MVHNAPVTGGRGMMELVDHDVVEPFGVQAVQASGQRLHGHARTISASASS